MADENYVRLGGACHCGEPVKLWSGRGRKPVFCLDHTPGLNPKPRQKKIEDCTVEGCEKKCLAKGLCTAHYNRSRRGAGPKVKKPPAPPRPTFQPVECPACRGFFTPKREGQKACSQLCRVRLRRGNKPRQMHPRTCTVCAGMFESFDEKAMYCGRKCKTLGWREKNPARTDYQPTLCAYFAKVCDGCGNAWGARRNAKVCPDCTRQRDVDAAREAHRVVAEAQHKAAGSVVHCAGCELDFCPLYDPRMGPKERKSCQVCKEALQREMRNAHRAKRKARIRSTAVESVVARKVFQRDGWLCRLCGIPTPEAKRGTYDHDAPELDHVVPVSRGGPHTYENTQCLCRSCNGWKAARTMEEVIEALAA